ncbi:MAG: hypothetical protein JO047_03460 [Alphaproteobacteria bacterium]|nr:hypothetical protein [Alphaproteobacteria bacterium]
MPFDGKEFKYAVKFGEPAGDETHGKLKWLFGQSLRSLAATVVGKQAYAVPQRLPETTEVVAAQLLRSAHAMIEREEMWVQGRYNARGGRHCAIGALRAAGRFYHSDTLRLAHALLHNVANSRGFDSVEKMNDASTHGQVLSAFASAIASAEALASSRVG